MARRSGIVRTGSDKIRLKGLGFGVWGCLRLFLFCSTPITDFLFAVGRGNNTGSAEQMKPRADFKTELIIAYFSNHAK